MDDQFKPYVIGAFGEFGGDEQIRGPSIDNGELICPQSQWDTSPAGKIAAGTKSQNGLF